MSIFLNAKIQFLIVWLSSFSVGAFLHENHEIGNIIGSTLAAIVVHLVKTYLTKRKAKKE